MPTPNSIHDQKDEDRHQKPHVVDEKVEPLLPPRQLDEGRRRKSNGKRESFAGKQRPIHVHAKCRTFGRHRAILRRTSERSRKTDRVRYLRRTAQRETCAFDRNHPSVSRDIPIELASIIFKKVVDRPIGCVGDRVGSSTGQILARRPKTDANIGTFVCHFLLDRATV